MKKRGINAIISLLSLAFTFQVINSQAFNETGSTAGNGSSIGGDVFREECRVPFVDGGVVYYFNISDENIPFEVAIVEPGSNVTVGGRIILVCTENLTLVEQSGSPSFCRENGDFEPKLGRCVKTDDGNETISNDYCPTIDDDNRAKLVPNGNIEPGNSTVGSRRRVRCRDGFMVLGDAFIECQSENRLWSSPGECVVEPNTTTIPPLTSFIMPNSTSGHPLAPVIISTLLTPENVPPPNPYGWAVTLLIVIGLGTVIAIVVTLYFTCKK